MANWAIILLVLGLVAGVLAFSGFGGSSTFMLLSAFFVLVLSGGMMLVAARRGRGKLT